MPRLLHDLKLPPRLYFRLLQTATAAVFLGRSWQHLVWDAPYRDLFWDEKWMSWIIHGVLGMDWEAYVTQPATDIYIQQFIKGVGLFYIVCALSAIFLTHLGKAGRIILRTGGASLVILAALYCKEKFFFTGQFFEYALQFGAPFFLVAISVRRELTAKQIRWMQVATALTFICHGLYAVGYYPRPGLFLEMVINILGVSNARAILFLNMAGILDFLASALLFMPNARIRTGAAAYMVIWGFLTAVARIWAFVHPGELLAGSLKLWVHETVFRFPHFLIPLVLVITFQYHLRNHR